MMESKHMGPSPHYPQSGYPPPQQQPYYPQGVVTNQPVHSTTIITQAPQARPSSYLGLSIFTLLCCNLLFGIIALVFSIMSSSAADDGDMEKARSQGRVAMWLNIAGIIISVVLVVIVIILYFTVFVTVANNALKTECEYPYYNC